MFDCARVIVTTSKTVVTPAVPVRIPLGGVSVVRASETLAEKIREIAADELEASDADIELDEGVARIVGTDRTISFADIAKAAVNPEDVTASGEFRQTEATYPNGTHICEVEIDPQTGVTEIIKYTIVDDFGVTVNPVMLEGQVHGGIVQGIGQCLNEHVVYDDEGQFVDGFIHGLRHAESGYRSWI